MSKNSKEEKIAETKEATKTKESTTKNTLKMNYKIFAVLLLVGGLAIGLLAGMLLNSCPASIQSMNSQEAGDKAVEFITTNLLGPGISAELVSIEELNGGSLYKLELNISDGSSSQVAESYITSDGEYIFPQGIPTGEFAALKDAIAEEQEQNPPQEADWSVFKESLPDELKEQILGYNLSEPKQTDHDRVMEFEGAEECKNKLIVFSNAGCGWCTKYYPILVQAQEDYPELEIYALDLMANRDIAEIYGVGGTPANIINCKYFASGYLDTEVLYEILEEYGK